MTDLNRRGFLQFIGAGALACSLDGCLRSEGSPARRGATLEKSWRAKDYWPTPQGDDEARRRLYLEWCAPQSPGGRTGFFSQIARLELGRDPVDEAPIREAIDFVYSKQDCNDFSVAGLLRIMYRYRRSPLIPPALIADIEKCILQFKYWWDEPGTDNRCYHTENHQIIYFSNQLLAGQLFPDRVFANSGKTGRDHAAHALPLIRQWMQWRVRFGFNEWLSNGYFDHDLMALTNLCDFAEPPDVRRNAKMLISVLLFEIALHSYRGVFGSTHGRTYAPMIKSGRGGHIASVCKLMLGMGVYNEPAGLGAVSLSTSRYRIPPIIQRVAADLDRPILARERHGFNVSDAPKYGLAFDSEQDALLFWSMQEYSHCAVLAVSKRISDTYHVRRGEKYNEYSEAYERQKKKFGRIVQPNIDGKSLGEVYIQTYRAPVGMLSCAQDFRPGMDGYQQHIWQATLGLDAAVFTNHPGSDNENSRPNYWAGNGVLPRAALHRNVLICIHRVPLGDEFPFSHAYFPHAAFDEVVERGHWLFGRKGEGFIALFSQNPTRWVKTEAGKPVERRADNPENVWVCELGEASRWNNFNEFIEAVVAAPIHCGQLSVAYVSPSAGRMEFGWEGPLRVDGHDVALHDYQRFDNPYCNCEFESPGILIRHEGEELRLNFNP